MGHPVAPQLQSCHMAIYVHVCTLCVCGVISASQVLQLKQAVCDVTSYNYSCSYYAMLLWCGYILHNLNYSQGLCYPDTIQ